MPGTKWDHLYWAGVIVTAGTCFACGLARVNHVWWGPLVVGLGLTWIIFCGWKIIRNR